MMRTPHGVVRTLQQGIIGAIIFSWVAAATTCSAAEGSIYKIEEEWEMVILEPDSINISPQVTFATSPTTSTNDSYFQLQMNYAADKDFSAGGFHVAAVQYEQICDEARSDTQIVLSTDGDRVRWTSVMAVIDNKVLFAVRDGYSAEWGAFGGPDYLVKITPSPVADLSGYHPQKSLDNVDISFGKNRVASVTLLQVKVFYTDGETVTMPVNSQP